MKENLSKKIVNSSAAQEENFLNWNNILQELKMVFGNDVYAL